MPEAWSNFDIKIVGMRTYDSCSSEQTETQKSKSVTEKVDSKI